MCTEDCAVHAQEEHREFFSEDLPAVAGPARLATQHESEPGQPRMDLRWVYRAQYGEDPSPEAAPGAALQRMRNSREQVWRAQIERQPGRHGGPMRCEICQRSVPNNVGEATAWRQDNLCSPCRAKLQAGARCEMCNKDVLIEEGEAGAQWAQDALCSGCREHLETATPNDATVQGDTNGHCGNHNLDEGHDEEDEVHAGDRSEDWIDTMMCRSRTRC